MDLSNDFRVGVPVDQTWNVLTDVERIAPLLPGAQLQEIDGDEYRGIVKVKVGPITAQYKGAAVFVDQDKDAGRVVLRCNGRDTRGQGNANATITATMKADGDGTRVVVQTDLTVTGKVAQFGRGVMADVSQKLIGQFVDALEADLQGDGAAPGAAAPAGDVSSNGAPVKEPAPSAAAATTSATAGAAAPGGETANPSEPLVATSAAQSSTAGAPTSTTRTSPAPVTAPSGPRKISGPEAKPVDLFDAAGGSLAKRLVPLLGGAAIFVVVLAVLRRRRG